MLEVVYIFMWWDFVVPESHNVLILHDMDG